MTFIKTTPAWRFFVYLLYAVTFHGIRITIYMMKNFQENGLKVQQRLVKNVDQKERQPKKISTIIKYICQRILSVVVPVVFQNINNKL